MKLFCIPYAGGNEKAYREWNPDKNIEVIPLKLRGRSDQLMQRPYSSLREAAEDCFIQIMDRVDDEPYAIFGHSMGAMIAYELYSVIRDCFGKMPEVMFLSGVNEPAYRYKGKSLDKISDEELMRYMVKLGSIPKEYSQNMILQNYIQTFRNDLKLLEDWKFQKSENLIKCDVVVICAKNDPVVSISGAKKWEKYTSDSFKFYKVKGNHFYFMSGTEELFSILKENMVSSDESRKFKRNNSNMEFKRYSYIK